MAPRDILARWGQRAKRELRTLRAIAGHSRTPRAVKWLTAGLVAYAVSPIDLIPDFIPVVGHLDEVLILPLGIWMVYRMTPAQVVAECRAKALESGCR